MENSLSLTTVKSFSLHAFGSYQSVHVHPGTHTPPNSTYVYTCIIKDEKLTHHKNMKSKKVLRFESEEK